MSIRTQLYQTPNGKVHVAWSLDGQPEYDVDVVDTVFEKAQYFMEYRVRKNLQKILSEYIRWRHLSLDKAGRSMYEETKKGLAIISQLCAKLTYMQIDSVRILARDQREEILKALPKTDNCQARALKDIIDWCCEVEDPGR